MTFTIVLKDCHRKYYFGWGLHFGLVSLSWFVVRVQRDYVNTIYIGQNN